MPSNPEAGNIYFDLSDKKLKIPQSNGSIVVFGSQVIDSALSGTSTNPVQNKAVKAELDKKAATTHSHNAATTILPGFMSDADKRKLDSIESGAEANVQSDWNASSTSDAVGNRRRIAVWNVSESDDQKLCQSARKPDHYHTTGQR